VELDRRDGRVATHLHLRLTADGPRHGGEVTVDGYEPSNGRLDAPDRTAEMIEVAAASIRWRRVVGAEAAG
jgi:hypothetical protein